LPRVFNKVQILFLASLSFIFFMLSCIHLLSGTAFGISFKDDLGRIVKIDVPPQRIISLSPGITEILFFLDLGDRVVGVTNFCDYPPAVSSKPSVGGLKANIEVVLSLKPDLVLGGDGVYQKDNMSMFQRFGIPFALFKSSSIEEVFSMIQSIGLISRVGVEAKEKIQSLREKLQSFRKAIESRKRSRLLYVVQREPLISVGKASFLNDLIRDAGGINITEKFTKDYPIVSMEFVIQADPQIIILAMDGDQALTDQQKRYWGRWSSLSAVQNGRIYKVNRDLLNRPGPRILEGLANLADQIHPNWTLEVKP